MEFVYTFLILLIAAIIAVPLSKRLGFGSVLGYLAAGLVIGPSGLGLITDVENIASISELGVVMLLFLIGLELRPARLWIMRRSVLGLGSAQVVLTSAALVAACAAMGFSLSTAILVGFALSLSSTALVLPLLAERDLLTSHAGRDSFAVLLFQDIAVIPAVALLPLLRGGEMEATSYDIQIAVLRAAGALALVLIGGRFFVTPIFKLVDGAKTPEIFTAVTLVVVGGTAALAHTVGLSMSLGAFMAGVLLSDSEYRHELRADIAPFEGVLLGIFFTSVGMSVDIGLLFAAPVMVLASVIGLMTIKGAVAFGLARIAGQSPRDAIRFGFALPQAGEFAFVLFAAAVAVGVMSPENSALVTLVIALSMIASPFLFSFEEKYVAPLLLKRVTRPFDEIHVRNDVIICGFGRVGQIVGRILNLHGIGFTALDNSAEQVELVRRFGAQAYYGDSSRLDLLRAAGAEEAKILVIAVEDVKQSLATAELAQRHFPHLKVLARARNRRHVHLLMDRGVSHIVRETFYSSLTLSERVLNACGVDEAGAKHTLELFEERDEKMLKDTHRFYDDEKQLIQTNRQVTEELSRILDADRKSGKT